MQIPFFVVVQFQYILTDTIQENNKTFRRQFVEEKKSIDDRKRANAQLICKLFHADCCDCNIL